MTRKFDSNIPNLLIMIRPKYFGFNTETAATNYFQNKVVSEKLNCIVLDEFDRVVEQLKDAKIRVEVFEDIDIPLPDAIFPNNWFAVLPGNMLTIFPMMAESRRKEVRMDIIKWITATCQIGCQLDLRELANEDQFLEGTGSIVFDHDTKTAYACESPRTSIPLFENFCRQIGYTPFSFESLDLHGQQIYHTNVMLSIATHYVLVNLESVENQLERSFLRLKLAQNGKELIELSHAQMNAFAANVFEVQNEKGESCFMISSTAHKSLRRDQIERIELYSKIITVDVSTIEQIGGGGIRCMIAGVFS